MKTDYINTVEDIINSTLEPLEKVRNILKIEKPSESDRVAGLIYNEASELEYFEKEEEGDFSPANEAEAAKLKICTKAIQVIK